MSLLSRVLVVETESQPGGLWHYACCLARGLRQAGCDVMVAATEPFEVLQGFEDLPVRAIGVRFPPAPGRPLAVPKRLLNQAGKARRLLALAGRFRPEIVHLNSRTGKLDVLYFRRLRALGARVVYTAHEPDPDTGVDWFDRARCRAADAVFVHSDRSREAVLRAGVEAARIARIPHGAYLDLCPDPDLPPAEARHALGLPPESRVVLFFGSVLPYKGLDVLIDAFAQAVRGAPEARLVIAGEPQEEFAPYRRRMERLRLLDRVVLDQRYVPFEEFPKYFRAADVVVFPYRWVQQSGALQLAYAYGRPVIATDVGGLYEAVREDGTGIIVPAGDAHALASALQRMLAERAAGEEMGRRARRLAETKYSWSAIAQTICGVYRAVQSRPSSSGRLPSPAG